MSNKIILKKSSVAAKVPLTTDLEYGELALNYNDGKLYFKNSSNNILFLGSSSATETFTNKTFNVAPGNGNNFQIQGNSISSYVGSGANVVLSSSPTITNLYTTGTGMYFGGSTSGVTQLIASATASGTLTLPATTGTLATLAGTETLTNKTLNGVTFTGPVNTGGNVGANGYVLVSAGAAGAPSWQANTAGSLDGLTDVVITSPTAQQILKFNGSIWQNAEPDVSIASAVFATNAESDLGSVTDLVIGISEDLGFVNEVAAYIYNMGSLVVDGIVSLNNIDQSIKADYISYAIIFGF